MYTNSTFFGKKAKQNTKTPFFWQCCIILSAEALLKPQGGHCAVLPLFSVCFYIEAERMCVNFSSSCGNWHTIFPFSAVPHSRLTRRTDIWTGWISDSACRLPGYKTVPPHGIAVPPPEKRQNLYGWSRSWFVSSVIAVLRGAASYYLAEYGGKIAAGTIMQFFTDLLQRFVCSC